MPIDPAGDGSHRRQPVVLPFTLVATMASSIVQLGLLAVLAAPLIDDVGLTRTELGLLGAVNTLVGAVTSPAMGRLTDRLGARRAVILCNWLSAIGLATFALSPSLPWLFVACAAGGVPQGWANPATNGLIATRVTPGRRGTVTGVKQSGITFAAFLGGLTMPGLEAISNWRGATWTFAIAIAVVAIAVSVLLAPDPAPPADSNGSSTAGRARTVHLPRVITWIAIYAFFMGLATGATGRFLPLFAEESLGFSTGMAGVFAALGGLLGMGARIWAARMAEHRFAPLRFMVALSFVGASLGVLLALMTVSTRWLMWLTPPLNAIGTNAWNAVAMIAVISMVPAEAAGRASGRVMFGFLGGLGLSAPTAGFMIDEIGYDVVWSSAAVVSLVAAAALVLSGSASRGAPESAMMARSTAT